MPGAPGTARSPMETKRETITISCVVTGLLAVSLIISGRGPGLGPTLTPLPPSGAAPEEMSAKDIAITDFGAVHAPVNGDANEYLIFGNVPVSPPAANLPSELAVFLGRWEGYDYSPPVKKDYKIVLVIQEITAQGGKAFLWLGTNLQYPSTVQEIHFRVVSGAAPLIEFETDLNSSKTTFALAYDRDKNLLRSPNGSSRSLELSRNQSFYVYKDYAQYLAGKRIYPKEYRDRVFPLFYGKGIRHNLRVL
jgi:hypothetical protein